MSNGIPRARVTVARADVSFRRWQVRFRFLVDRPETASIPSIARSRVQFRCTGERLAPVSLLSNRKRKRSASVQHYTTEQTSNLRIASIIYHSRLPVPRCVIPGFLRMKLLAILANQPVLLLHRYTADFFINCLPQIPAARWLKFVAN